MINFLVTFFDWLKSLISASLISLKYPQPRGEQLYFGCDGSYKKASRVSIECRNYGLICPEVEAWKEKNQIRIIMEFVKSNIVILPSAASLKNGQKSVDMQNQFIITEGQRATFLSQ